MYLSYEEYKQFGGTEAESVFEKLEFKARKQIDLHTFGRFVDKEIPEEVKRCIYELIGTEQSMIASESVDGYNITYKNDKDVNRNIIKTYLSECKVDGIPCLYRGT